MYGEAFTSASAIPSFFDSNLICRALTVEEIKKIMRQFTFSASCWKDAGFDAIENAHGIPC